MRRAGRIVTRDWDLYDTRHVVYRPGQLAPEALKRATTGLPRRSTPGARSSAGPSAHRSTKHRLKHFFYSAGWKKFERAWDP